MGGRGRGEDRRPDRHKRGRMMSAEGFRARFPALQVSTYREVLGDMPEAWQQRLWRWETRRARRAR